MRAARSARTSAVASAVAAAHRRRGFTFGFALAGLLSLLPAGDACALTVDDIVSMSEAGVSADVLVQTIERSRSSVTLGAGDEARLRRAGIEERVIEALRRRASKGAAVPDEPPAADAEAPPDTAAPLTPAAPAAAAQLEETRRAGEEFRRAEAARRAAEIRRQEEARRREAEELQAEAAKLQREAEEMAQALAAAPAEGRSVAVEEALSRGLTALDRGRHAEAIRLFDAFLKSRVVAPSSHRFVEGEWGLGDALYRAGIVYGSAPHFVDVLRRGTATRRFDGAFLRLRDLVSRVDYAHPVFELLATLDVGGRPNWLQDEVRFFLGQFYGRYGDAARALEWFGRVSEESSRQAAASYQRGLLLVARKQLLPAVKAFELAVAAAEEAGQRDVYALAYLGLARVAFEVGSYEVAARYYDRVPRTSRWFAPARHEAAWAQFMAQDAHAALGTLHALSTPAFVDSFFPDLQVVEATVYLNLCRFAEAREVVAAYRGRFGAIAGAVRRFLDSQPDAAAALQAMQAMQEMPGTLAGQEGGGGGASLPVEARRAVLADVDFYVAESSRRQVERELELVRRLGLEQVGAGLGQLLEARRRTLSEQAGLAVLRRLRDLRGELGELALKVTEITFEVELAEKERLFDETQALYRGGVRRQAGEAAPRRDRVRTRSSELAWPLEDEIWDDELPSYRSWLRGACDGQ